MTEIAKPPVTASTPKRAICFLPSGEMLRLKPVRHWLKRFSDFSRRSATEIVLPAIGVSGPLFESRVHRYPKVFKATELLPNWVKQAREELPDKGTVWASIVINCGFLDNKALWLRNQYDLELSQICIVNPVSQEILKDLIGEVIEAGVDGIVLDVTDAYPNSHSDAYSGIIAHCFCDDCMEGLRLNGFTEPKECFVGEKGLMRLVLRNDDDGTAHLDPTQEWIDQRNANAVVTLALARKFVQGDRPALELEATRLLGYFRARVQMTAVAIRSILAATRDTSKRSAVVLGSDKADLSQMVTLEALDNAKSADEYWLPDAPNRTKTNGQWQAAQFLAARSTYYFNAFFEVVEDAADRIILQEVDGFLQSLLRTSKRLMSNKLTPGAAYTVGKLSQFSGFVGVPLGQEDHLEIIERLTREITGGVLPDKLLAKFRIPNPDKQA